MELKQIADEMQPRTEAARDWVFKIIRTAIVRGVLPGGMPLRQDEISAALKVSHIPIREAFRQLEAQGLVRIYHNRGAVVTKLTQHELENVMDTRIMLEIGAFKTAIPLMTEADTQHAQELLNMFQAERNPQRYDTLNLQFHFALYSPCNNDVALSMIDQLHANSDRYLRPYYPKEDDSAFKAIEEHQALIDACRKKNTELACAVLRTHLESTKTLLLTSPLLT
ncbi:MAG: GntR family transcriptional regulator [Christensenellales bacterium]